MYFSKLRHNMLLVRVPPNVVGHQEKAKALRCLEQLAKSNSPIPRFMVVPFDKDFALYSEKYDVDHIVIVFQNMGLAVKISRECERCKLLCECAALASSLGECVPTAIDIFDTSLDKGGGTVHVSRENVVDVA